MKHRDGLGLSTPFQLLGKCAQEQFQVGPSVRSFEQQSSFFHGCVDAFCVQHARDMRSAPRQFHFVFFQELRPLGRPFAFNCRHIDAPVWRQTHRECSSKYPAGASSSRYYPTTVRTSRRISTHLENTGSYPEIPRKCGLGDLGLPRAEPVNVEIEGGGETRTSV